jgi:SAM-dependent MidA family methyltransferase
MHRALYGPDGFFVTAAPGEHFRTSVHASPLFTGALARLLVRVDEALDRPKTLSVIDVGAGRGELLLALRRAAPAELAARLRLTAVEMAPRPATLPEDVAWLPELPREPVIGLLVATEWLDNVPLDVAALDPAGTARYVRIDDSLGEPLAPPDAAWLDRWWPLRPGTRAEIGAPRDAAWAAAVAAVTRGLALAVDYGHLANDRPPLGTLTGYRSGRQVPPVPDGSCDLTAHVAFDAVAAAPTAAVASGALATSTSGPIAAAAPGLPAPMLLRQREALHALGVSGARPPLAQSSTDPAGYLRALASAGAAAELTEPAGLGGHFWLMQPVGLFSHVLGCEA